MQWRKYCQFLAERYGELLPTGYVFRLPTEAEWEWSLVADENGTAWNIDARYDSKSQKAREIFAKMLRKHKELQCLHPDTDGWIAGVYVGGRTEGNAFGVCDMLHTLEEFVFDIYTANDCGVTWGGCAVKNVFYNDHEIDPVHWDGRLSNEVLMRGSSSGVGRRMSWLELNETGLAHIVIGPDIETELKKKELADYPQEDFSGEFIGGMAKVFKMSSIAPNYGMGSDKAMQRMLTRENVRESWFTPGMERNECGWRSQNEESPWLQIALENKLHITGLQLECYSGNSKQIRVWVSDDGVHEREIFKDERAVKLYRVDLQSRNIKAKYIRIGRAPEGKNDNFCLNKILIYGKK